MKSGGEMERRGNPIRTRSCAVNLWREAAKPTSSGIVGEVHDYRCFLRLLPRRVYSAIVVGIWETVLGREPIRIELLHKPSMKPPV